MRLVRRALAGAGASLALGALFAGAALGAEPTTAEAAADATLNVGLGGGDNLGVDIALDGMVAADDASESDADVRLDATAAAHSGLGETTGTAGATVALGVAADEEAADSLDGDGAARIELDASRASSAGTGANAGSTVLIDLDTGRDDAVAASAGLVGSLGATAGDGTDASGDAALDLAMGAGDDPASRSTAAAGVATKADAAPSSLVDAGNVLGTLAQGSVTADGGPEGDGGPAGGDGALAPAGTPAGSGASLPDTAFGAGNEVTLWGLLLAILAGLAFARRLPVRRP